MVNMQGLDAIEEIKLVQDTIHAIAAHWQLDIIWVKDMCSKIDRSITLLGEEHDMMLRL